MREMSKTTPKKEEKEDDSTIKLAYGYRKRCDHLGIPASPVLRGILDATTEGGKNPNAKLVQVPSIAIFSSM